MRSSSYPARNRSGKANEPARNIRAAGLNLLYADAQHIAWQVTGRYPNRRGGRGLLPSPGWDNRYDWDGFADSMLHRTTRIHPRLVGHSQPPHGSQWLRRAVSNSWYYPERAERIAQLAPARKHDAPKA